MPDDEISYAEILAESAALDAEAAQPGPAGNPNQPFADPRAGAALIGPGPQPYPPGQEPTPGTTGGLARALPPVTVEEYLEMVADAADD